MIHFFYNPTQAYLKKFPVSIFQKSFSRYDDDVVFKVLEERFIRFISPGDSVFFYNMRYTSRPKMCSDIEARGGRIINKPKLDGKLEMAKAFAEEGLPSPKYSFAKSGKLEPSSLNSFRFPIIIKPIKGSAGGKGIFFCESLSEAPRALEKDMIIQEYITDARNHIIRLNPVDDKVMLSVKVITETGSPIINAASNGITEIYTPTQEECDLAVAGTRVAGLDISGVDMAQTKSGPVIIEVNAVPGFTSGAKFGIPFHDYIVDLIVKRAREYQVLTATSRADTI